MIQPAPGRPLVFSHIPKTAGTALFQAIREVVQPQRSFVGFDRVTFGAFRAFDEIDPAVRPAVTTNPSEIPDDVDLLSGHISPSTTLARFPDAPHVTILREARSRVLSIWLFSRAHNDLMLRRWGPYGTWMRVARRPLSEYLAEPSVAAHTDNAIARFLLWPHPLIPDADFIAPEVDEQLVADAMARLNGYAFVGIVEDPDVIDRLGSWLGSPLEVGRSNEARPIARRLRPDVGREVDQARDLLHARTRLDHRIWAQVAARTIEGVDPDALADQVLATTVARQSRAVAAGGRKALAWNAADTGYRVATRLRGAS